MIDRTKEPELNSIDTLNIIEPEKIKLENGVPVYLFYSPYTEIIKIDFLFDAGSYFQNQMLIASFTNIMLSEGTRSYSAFDIAEKLDFYGARLFKSSDTDTASLTLSMLHKHFYEVLPVLFEIIFCPTFPEKELALRISKSKQHFIDDCLRVNELAEMNFRRQLFGKYHPYGNLVQLDDYDKINSNLLKDFHEKNYRLSNCKIVLSGKFTSKTKAELNRYFGQSVKGKINKDKARDHKIVGGKQKQIIKMPDALQSAIRIGKISINKIHPDYHGLMIVNTLLGGYFGSRLMKNIREDKGFTYGIYSVLTSFRHSGAFYIGSEVGADVCSKAIKEVYKELKKLREYPVSAEELDLVRKYLMGLVLRSFDGPFKNSERFLNMLEYNVNFKKFYSDFVDKLNNISSDELISLANKYLHEDTMFELVAGRK